MNRAIERLSRARGELDRARAATDPAELKRAFESGLDDVRSAFNLARRENTKSQTKKTKSDCRLWWEGRDKAGRADELVGWAWTRRDVEQHEGGVAYVEEHYVETFSTDDVVQPAGWEDATLVVDMDGSWWIKDDGTTRQRKIRATLTGASALSKNIHGIGINDGPASHRSQPLPAGATILDLLEMAIDWTQETLDDALKLWPTDNHD